MDQYRQKSTKKRKLGTEGVRGPLIVAILRQLGVGFSELGNFIGDLLELIGHLRELLVGCAKVRSGGDQVLLQLRHLCLEHCLLLGGVSGTVSAVEATTVALSAASLAVVTAARSPSTFTSAWANLDSRDSCSVAHWRTWLSQSWHNLPRTSPRPRAWSLMSYRSPLPPRALQMGLLLSELLDGPSSPSAGPRERLLRTRVLRSQDLP